MFVVLTAISMWLWMQTSALCLTKELTSEKERGSSSRQSVLSVHTQKVTFSCHIYCLHKIKTFVIISFIYCWEPSNKLAMPNDILNSKTTSILVIYVLLELKATFFLCKERFGVRWSDFNSTVRLNRIETKLVPLSSSSSESLTVVLIY